MRQALGLDELEKEDERGYDGGGDNDDEDDREVMMMVWRQRERPRGGVWPRR